METKSKNFADGTDPHLASSCHKPRGRRFKLAVVAVVLVGAAVLAIPQVISKTSWRNTLLQSLIGDSSFSVSSAGASFGWFSPLEIDEFKLDSSDSSVTIAVKQLRAEKSWLSLWLSSPDLGKVEVSSPRIELIVTDEEEASGESVPRFDPWPKISVAVRDGSLLLREKVAKPVIDLRQVDIGFSIKPQPTGAILEVDPFKFAEHETLTPEQCNQGLQLILPGLSDEVSLEGEYSLELTKIRFSLDSQESNSSSDATQIEGVVTLHQVTTGLKNEVTKRLAMMAAELMEVGEVPRRIRLAENSKLAFRFERGRVHHEGIAFAFPGVSSEFSVRTTGSVGLDESIDLQGLIQIPLSALTDSPLARQLSESPIEVHVSGTIDEPKVGLPAKQEWISKLDNRLLSPDLSADEKKLADKITDLLGDLVDETARPLPPLSEPLLERVRKGEVADSR